MYLGKSRSIRAKVKHSIYQENLPNVPENVQFIVSEYLKTGSKELRDLLIETHIRLVLSVGSRYIYYYPQKSQIIVNECLYCLTYWVTRARTNLGPPYNLGGWLTTKIHTHINDNVLTRDSVIPVDSRADIPKIVNLEGYIAAESKKIDVKNLILETKLTDLERSVMLGKLEGHTFVDMSKFLNVSSQYLSRVFNEACRKIRSSYDAEA